MDFSTTVYAECSKMSVDSFLKEILIILIFRDTFESHCISESFSFPEYKYKQQTIETLLTRHTNELAGCRTENKC